MANETMRKDPDEKRYFVQCDDCAFEVAAEGLTEAKSIGTEHRQETKHDIVAVEAPRSTIGP